MEPNERPPGTRPPGQNTSRSGRRRSFPSPIARRIRARDGECQLRFDGCTGGADEADHIMGWADAVAAGWAEEDINDEANGQAACSECHEEKTQGQIDRGRARAAATKPRNRPKPKHPGLR